MKPECYIIDRIIQVKYLLHDIFHREKMATAPWPHEQIITSVLFSLYPNTRHTSTVRWPPDGHLICLAEIPVQSAHGGMPGLISTSIWLAEYNRQPRWPAKFSLINNNTPDYEQHLV